MKLEDWAVGIAVGSRGEVTGRKACDKRRRQQQNNNSSNKNL
jgi:hypothetical protein